MDNKTIFPLLKNGEDIVDTFKDQEFGSGTQLHVVITNYRLLTRKKRTVCCCVHRSSYSAISLDSINRIDEDHQKSNLLAYIIIWILVDLLALAGILVPIFVIENITTQKIIIAVSAVVLTLASVAVLTCVCFRSKRKVIELAGTFGSTTIDLDKVRARLFVAELSRQISQTKVPIQSAPSPIYTISNQMFKDDELILHEQF